MKPPLLGHGKEKQVKFPADEENKKSWRVNKIFVRQRKIKEASISHLQFPYSSSLRIRSTKKELHWTWMGGNWTSTFGNFSFSCEDLWYKKWDMIFDVRKKIPDRLFIIYGSNLLPINPRWDRFCSNSNQFENFSLARFLTWFLSSDPLFYINLGDDIMDRAWHIHKIFIEPEKFRTQEQKIWRHVKLASLWKIGHLYY